MLREIKMKKVTKVVGVLLCGAILLGGCSLFQGKEAKKTAKVEQKSSDSFADFGLGKEVESKVSADSPKENIRATIWKFGSHYKMKIPYIPEDFKYKSYGRGINVTEDISGYHFIFDNHGRVMGFFTKSKVQSAVLDAIGNEFISKAWVNGLNLWISGETNGLVGQDGEPLLQYDMESAVGEKFEFIQFPNSASFPSFYKWFEGLNKDEILKEPLYSFTTITGETVYGIEFNGGTRAYFRVVGNGGVLSFVGLESKVDNPVLRDKITEDMTNIFSSLTYAKTKRGYLWIEY